MSGTPATYMTQAQAGSIATTTEDALVRALEQNQPQLRRLAARFGLHGHEADDAVQDIVSLAWAARSGFRGDSAASTWLTRIAVNYLTSYRRKLARRWKLWTERSHEMDRVPAVQPIEDEPSEQYKQALSAVDALPVRLRRVFILRYLEEMSVDEVAEILQIPAGTVRSRGYHARLRLRNALRGIHE